MLPDYASHPVFDEAQALDLLENDRELLGDVVELFRSTSQSLLADMVRAGDEGDLTEVARVAHSLKGASANVCAERIRVLSAALEAGGRDGQPMNLPDYLAALETEVNAFRAETETVT